MTQPESRIVNIVRFVSVHLLQNVLGIVRSKSVALLLGAAGVGILGQVLTFYSFQTKLLMFGITAALVNSVNEAGKRQWRRDDVRFCNFLIVIATNLVFLAILMASPATWAQWIFAGVGYEYLIFLLAGLGIIYSFAMFLELNYQADLDYRTLALGRSISFGVGLLFIVPFVYWWGVAGVIADLMLVFTTSILFFVVKTGKNSLMNYIGFRIPQIEILKYVWRVSRYDVARSIAVIGALLITRIYILHSLGEINNGYFQSIWAVTNYVDVILQGFMVYFYPAITKTVADDDLREELQGNFSILVYLILPILTILIIFPEVFLFLLFSAEFVHLHHLLALAALGKVLNFFYFFYSIVFLAKNHLRLFLVLEVVRGASMILLTTNLVNQFGLIGAVWVFLLTDLICLLFVIVALWHLPILRLSKAQVLLYLKLLTFLLVIYFLPASWPIRGVVALGLGMVLFDYKNYGRLFKQLLPGSRG